MLSAARGEVERRFLDSVPGTTAGTTSVVQGIAATGESSLLLLVEDVVGGRGVVARDVSIDLHAIVRVGAQIRVRRVRRAHAIPRAHQVAESEEFQHRRAAGGLGLDDVHELGHGEGEQLDAHLHLLDVHAQRLHRVQCLGDGAESGGLVVVIVGTGAAAAVGLEGSEGLQAMVSAVVLLALEVDEVAGDVAGIPFTTSGRQEGLRRGSGGDGVMGIGRQMSQRVVSSFVRGQGEGDHLHIGEQGLDQGDLLVDHRDQCVLDIRLDLLSFGFCFLQSLPRERKDDE